MACILFAGGLAYLNLRDFSPDPALPAGAPRLDPPPLRALVSARGGELAQGLSRVMETRPLLDQVQALESLAPESDRAAYALIGESDEGLRLRRVLRSQRLVETDVRHAEMLRRDSQALLARPAETREAVLRGAERLAESLEDGNDRALEARVDARTRLLTFLALLSPADARAVTQLALRDIELSERSRYSANPQVAEAVRSQAQVLVIAAGADARTQKEATLRVMQAASDPAQRRAYLDRLALLHPAEAAEIRAEFPEK